MIKALLVHCDHLYQHSGCPTFYTVARCSHQGSATVTSGPKVRGSSGNTGRSVPRTRFATKHTNNAQPFPHTFHKGSEALPLYNFVSFLWVLDNATRVHVASNDVLSHRNLHSDQTIHSSERSANKNPGTCSANALSRHRRKTLLHGLSSFGSLTCWYMQVDSSNAQPVVPDDQQVQNSFHDTVDFVL